MSNGAKPKLLFLRFGRPDLPSFIKLHVQEQLLCLSQHFDVVVIDDHSCDYDQLCQLHEPDIAMFESGGYYGGRRHVSNVSSCPTVPRIGFIHCDAFCPTRKIAIRDMARWEISTFFGISVSLGSYTPSIADKLFIWPNFVNPELYRDYSFPKVIPILFSGNQASFYPWRSRIDRIVSQHYPTLHSPHFGWTWNKGGPSASGFLEGEKYAQLINSAWVAPTCGTITNEIVRKHFEIPACNTCLLTQKTAALEAAGFVDLVNCVFADDTDVLDKLEWLFQRPEELERITGAGKQLVDSRHTMRQRDQIFQWYTLHKTLRHGQKIVQPGPFLPLTVVEEQSGVNNGHVVSGGIDRLLMIQADEQLRLGRYVEAERLYRRCLNYKYPYIPEPEFRLILCLLHKGNSKAALAIVRANFISHRLSHDEDFEPDPTEWARFIIVLLCCGKNREAALRADQYPTVCNKELYRVRGLVRILNGRKSETGTAISRTGQRASIHQSFELESDEWLESIVRMLSACGQTQTVSRLAEVGLMLQSLEMSATSVSEPQDSTAATIRAQKNCTSINERFASATKQGSFKTSVFTSYLSARSRLDRFAQRVASQSQKLMTRLRRHAPYSSSQIAENDRAAIVRMLQKEEVKSAVLLGAANGSWLADAFMCGMQKNPHMPSVVCINHDTPKFRKLHKRFFDAPNVEFRYLPSEGGGFCEQNEAADVIAVHSYDILKDLRCETDSATLVLLDHINSNAGSEYFRGILSDENYLLVVHEPAQCDGFAVFRRAAVKAARPSPAVLRRVG